MTIQQTTDSFGKPLWKVEYIQRGKRRARTFYTEGEAINFEKHIPALENTPIAKPRKQTRHSREVPKW